MGLGHRGVRAVLGGCVALTWPGLLIFGYPGLMGRHWQETFQVGRGAVGAILFFALAGVGTFMFFTGRWQERYGTRRVVLAGEILCAASLVLAAHAPNMATVYLWGFAVGTASCFVYLPAVTVAQLWFPARKGLASGVVNLVFAGSAALLAPALGWALAAAAPLRVHWALAALVLASGGAAALWVVPPAGTQARGPAPAAPSLTPRQSLRTAAFWFLWATWALQGAAGISMVTLAVPVGTAKGFSFKASLGILTAFNLGSGASRLLVGFASDSLGRTRAMAATFLLAGLGYLLLPHAANPWTCAASALAVGFAFGTLFAVSAPLAMECFGPRHFGTVFGLVFTAYGYLSGLLGPWLSGRMLDASGGELPWTCRYLGLLCLGGALLVRRVRPPVASGPAPGTG